MSLRRTKAPIKGGSAPQEGEEEEEDVKNTFPLFLGGLCQTWNISNYVKRVLVKCAETKKWTQGNNFAKFLSMKENLVPKEVLNFTHITEIKVLGNR